MVYRNVVQENIIQKMLYSECVIAKDCTGKCCTEILYRKHYTSNNILYRKMLYRKRCTEHVALEISHRKLLYGKRCTQHIVQAIAEHKILYTKCTQDEWFMYNNNNYYITYTKSSKKFTKFSLRRSFPRTPKTLARTPWGCTGTPVGNHWSSGHI